MTTTQWLVKSEIGPLYLVASKKGLQGIFWTKQAAPMAKTLNGAGADIKILSKTIRQLENYLTGKRKIFDLPFDLAGTPFEHSVWKQLDKIPYGSTCSYGEIARRIKNPKAARAVGTAVGNNPLCMIVPCHRVIAADGSIGGYSGGLSIKKKLLKLELTDAF